MRKAWDLSIFSSVRDKKRIFVFLISCTLLSVLIVSGCYRQTAMEAGSPSMSAERKQLSADQGSASKAAVSQPVVASAKPYQSANLSSSSAKIVFDVPHDREKRVALTFDDGPSQMTPEYLQILRDKGVHATFFLIGKQAENKPGLAKTIVDSGNEIGNHTCSHLNIRTSSMPESLKDILECQSIIERDSHHKPFMLRPPGGEFNKSIIEQLQKVGYIIVLWNIDPQDWKKSATPDQIINNVMTNIRPGAIILMHEGKKPTLEALPRLIDDIKEQGYEIGTVSELLDLSSPNQSSLNYNALLDQTVSNGATPKRVIIPYDTP